METKIEQKTATEEGLTVRLKHTQEGKSTNSVQRNDG